MDELMKYALDVAQHHNGNVTQIAEHLESEYPDEHEEDLLQIAFAARDQWARRAA